MFRSANDWIKEYQDRDAYWLHDGNPKRPHALLTSGKHSNGFFNSRLVIPDTVLLREAASDLLAMYYRQVGNLSGVRGVVGPQTGATKLADLLSVLVVTRARRPCFHASPAKSEQNGVKSVVFSAEERALLPGQSVLLCEDVLTTGGSVDLTAEAVNSAGGTVLPFVVALVNRSGLPNVYGRRVIALIDRDMPMWAPEECQLCKLGSEAIRPKGENWARLNAEY